MVSVWELPGAEVLILSDHIFEVVDHLLTLSSLLKASSKQSSHLALVCFVLHDVDAVEYGLFVVLDDRLCGSISISSCSTFLVNLTHSSMLSWLLCNLSLLFRVTGDTHCLCLSKLLHDQVSRCSLVWELHENFLILTNFRQKLFIVTMVGLVTNSSKLINHLFEHVRENFWQSE